MTEFFGYAGGAFLMISFLPQLIKSARTRSMQDLSWGMLLATFASAVSYEIYAYLLGLTPVVIMNGIFLLSLATAMTMKWRFDHA